MTTKKQKLGPNQLKWIKSLETTKRKQIKRHLRTKDGYCCLGVACAVLGAKAKLEPDGYRYSYHDEMTTLPSDIKNKLKLRTSGGSPKSSDPNFHMLFALNDDWGYSFKQIAQVLREHPEEYFREPA